MQPIGSRPLAPAPPLSATPGGSPPGDSSPTHGQNPTSSIKRASTACQSCKQIKRKCDQAQPCSNCRKAKTKCIYNEAEDGRRKAARKRTVETLELKRDALDSILDSFRTSSDVHARGLLELIRENVPLEEVVQYAIAHKSDLPDRQIDELVSQLHEQPRKSVMSVIALCDTPLVQIPSQPWTAITTDDEFVSHLISIFFTWYYTAYPTVDKDLFLRDMAAGSLHCHFCSSLLVNSMLALACNFSDHPKACQIPSNGSTRGQHFFDEATRLWMLEAGKPTLVNVQAASCLAVTSCLLGKDRLSWSYVEQMNEMVEELRIKQIHHQKLGLTPDSPELSRSLSLATDTVFLLTVGYGIAFMKPCSKPLLAQSALAISGNIKQEFAWVPYPRQLPEVVYNPDLLREAFHGLHRLGHQIQSFVFGGKNDISSVSTASLDGNLVDWKASLPEALQSYSEISTVRPPVMDLHIAYQFLRITLFSFTEGAKAGHTSEPMPFLQTTSTTTMSIQNSVVDVTSLLQRQISNSSQELQSKYSLSYYQAQLLESAKEVALMCQLYHRDFGLKQPSMWMPQAAASAAYSLIDGPIPLADPEVSEIFHELCLVLTAASRRWLVMKGHVRMLLVTATTKGAIMIAKTRQILQFVASDSWRDDDHKMFASSIYPNYALAKDGEDPRLTGMGDLLESWAGINLTQDTAVQDGNPDPNIETSQLTSTTPKQAEGHDSRKGYDAE